MGFGIQNWLQSMCGNLFRCFSQIQTSSACPLWSFCFEMFWKDCSREYSCLAKIIRNKIAELSSHLFFPTATTRVAKQAGEKKNYLFFFEITRNLPTVNWKKNNTCWKGEKSLPPNRKRGTSRPQPWAVLCSGVPSPGAIEDMCFWSYCQTRPRSHPRKKTEFRNKSLPKCSMYGIVVYI